MTDTEIAQNILRAIQLGKPSILRIDSLTWLSNLYRGYSGSLPDLSYPWHTPAMRKEWRVFLGGNCLRDVITSNYPMMSRLASINHQWTHSWDNRENVLKNLWSWKACVGILYYVRSRLPLFSYRFKFTMHDPWGKTVKGWHDEISDTPQNALAQFMRTRISRVTYKFHSVKRNPYNWKIEFARPAVINQEVLAIVTSP